MKEPPPFPNSLFPWLSLAPQNPNTDKEVWQTLRQYFLWYLIFLPLYLPRSSFLRNARLGIAALLLWVLTQAAWLQQGYGLEFLGQSTFVPGLWTSSLGFFLANCWILGVIVGDVV